MPENIKLTKVPSHIAVIVDGNRRWAKEQNKSVNFGHKKGGENISNLCKWCIKYKIKYLTLYCLSVENLNRSELELKFLFRFFKTNMSKSNLEKYHKNGVNVNIVGDNTLLPKDIVKCIEKVKNNQIKKPKLQLQICFGYSGRNEIINATKEIVKKIEDKQLTIDEINEQNFSSCLFTKDIPDIDLMIRTGGDLRISNFLLWKLSYAELYFCDKYFPAFDEKDFLLALYNFQNRIRRYGK